MSIKIDRTGEVKTARCGLEMTIIGYRNVKDIDIQFSDGEIVKNRSYQNFKTGKISHPFLSDVRMKFIGKETINFQGLKMKIIEYISTTDIDVAFEDGTVVKHKQYRSFSNRQIAYPYEKRYVGQEKILKNGLKAKIIKYVKSIDIDVEFEDGYIAKHQAISDWKIGNIGHPKYNNNYINRTEETAIASNGMKMTIIRYSNCSDIDIKFEDGYIAYHKRYNDFLKGYIHHPTKNILNLKKESKIGLKKLAINGQWVEIIDYINYDDITVKFEDGTITKTRCSSFTTGYIHNPNKPHNKISFEEFLLADYLSNYGFIRMPPGSLKDIDKDFGKMEFDMYNPELRIAIEYDGIFHNEKFKLDKNPDIKKDTLCQKNGIRIIRIRNCCKLLNSNISKQILFKFKTSKLDDFPKLISKIKETYPKELSYIPENIPDIYQCAERFYQFTNKQNQHIGERKLSKCGLNMQIIQWINSNNITVEFEDGYIVKHRRYYDFKKDKIRHINPDYVFPANRVGEVMTTGKNLEATIITYRNYHDIDVKFSDGSYAYHRDYGNFKKGKIAPDKK